MAIRSMIEHFIKDKWEVREVSKTGDERTNEEKQQVMEAGDLGRC